MKNYIHKHPLVSFSLLLLVCIAFVVFVLVRKNAPSDSSPHDSWLNPAASNFFSSYDIYYTGWDNYLLNGKDLGPAETGTSTSRAIEVSLSKQPDSAAKNNEVVRDFQKGQAESRVLTIFPHGAFVIEGHNPSDLNNSFAQLSGSLLKFGSVTYNRDPNSNYVVDGDKIAYVACLGQFFDEQSNGNLCDKFALYVNNAEVDATPKGTSSKYVGLDISLVNNHVVYYTKTDQSFNVNYYSYDLGTGIITLLKDSDGFGCDVLGFAKGKPVDFCPNYDSTPFSYYDILIAGVPTYRIKSLGLGNASSDNVAVIDDHVYYSVIDKADNEPTKISLIKDGIKVAEAEVDRSQFFTGSVHPTDGSQVGCLIENNLPTPQFCIIGDHIISKSNYGFDQNQYYLDGKNIDFSPYNIELNPQSPDWKPSAQTIWQLDILPDTEGGVAKVVIQTLEPNNVYASSLSQEGTLSKPELLVSNVGGIVGVTLK